MNGRTDRIAISISRVSGGESTLDLCFGRAVKFRSDSIHITPLETAKIITGVLLDVGFSCVGKYTALLISSLGMSGVTPAPGL